MTRLGELGGRPNCSMGWDFSAASSFLPTTLFARPRGECLAGTTTAFLPRGCFLKTWRAEAHSEPGLGPGADAEDTEAQGLTEVYSGCSCTGQRSPHSLHASPKLLPCSELHNGSRGRTSTSPCPPSSLRSLGTMQRGVPQRSPPLLRLPWGVTWYRGAVVGVHEEPQESCKQDSRSSCHTQLA